MAITEFSANYKKNIVDNHFMLNIIYRYSVKSLGFAFWFTSFGFF